MQKGEVEPLVVVAACLDLRAVTMPKLRSRRKSASGLREPQSLGRRTFRGDYDPPFEIRREALAALTRLVAATLRRMRRRYTGSCAR